MELALSDHAIDRMLERRINHAEVLDAIEHGKMTVKLDHHAVFRTRRIKVYACATNDTLVVVTVARRDQGYPEK
jgi:hypothetical protein